MILCSSGVFFVRGPDGGWVIPDGPEIGAIGEIGPLLGVDGIELLVTRGQLGHLDAVADLLDGFELPVPVIHAPKRVGAALPSDEAVAALDESARFAARIGADVAVLHLWDLPESDRDFARRLDMVVLAADVFETHGVTLAIETIPCLVGTPLRNIERVLEREPRVGVALDTEFLAMHDEIDDAIAADWLWPRVRHVHLKDFTDALVDGDGVRRFHLPGTGTIDFAKIFAALATRGYGGAVSLEAPAVLPEGGVDVDALRACFARMSHSPWRFD
jgi:sugar phosphate isomerase/epimerase